MAGVKSEARLRDEECVRRCLAGDANAFAPIYAGWIPFVRACVRARIAGPDVEDIVQTTFMRAYETLDKFDPYYRISTFLKLHARNAVAEYLWKREMCQRRGWRRVPDWSLMSGDDPAATAEVHQVFERVDRALSKVPEYQLKTMEDYVGGMEQGAIAEREGITRGAVSMRLMAVRKHVHASLRRWE